MREPDFFIVGAPRCGTTAMNNYLQQHPEVYIPKRKEAHFFGSDLRAWYFIRDEAVYRSLFRGVRGERRVGECSVWYLYSKRAAAEIKAFAPDASIIIMLRNPVDMLYSLHATQLFVGREDIEDFGRALEAEGDRKRGLRIPRNSDPVETLYYGDVAKFPDQVSRYLDLFGRENVHVIIFDDFRRDTTAIFQRACEFLGVDPSFRPDFAVVNPSMRARSEAVRDFLVAPPPAVRRLDRYPVVRRLVRRGMSILRRLNREDKARPPLDPDLRRRLQEEFAPDVSRLSSLLGRDLSSWNGA